MTISLSMSVLSKSLNTSPTSVYHILLGQSFGERLSPQAQVQSDKFQASERRYRNGTGLKQTAHDKPIDSTLPKRLLPLLDNAATCRGLPEICDVDSKGPSRIEFLCLSFGSKVQMKPEVESTNHEVVLILAQVGNGPSLSRTLGAFTVILRQKAKDLDIEGAWSRNTCTLKLSDSRHYWIRSVRKTVRPNNCGKGPIPMVLVIIDGGESNKRAYEKVKFSFTIGQGLQSTCILMSTLKKAHSKDIDNGLDKYVGALLRKVFAKSQGYASAKLDPVRDARSTTSQKNDDLFIGFHVAHLPVQEVLVQNKGSSDRWTSAVTITTKFMGEGGPYQTSTKLLPTYEVEKKNLSKAFKNYIEKLDARVKKGKISRTLLFGSGVSHVAAPNLQDRLALHFQWSREKTLQK